MTIEAALRAVATTRQRQLRGRLLRMADFHGPAVPVSLTLAGITAVVLVAIGLGLNNEPVPGVEDSPPPGVATEEPVPTEIPYGYVMFRNEADGYEIALPRAWEVQVEPAYGEPHPGVTRFGSGDEDRPPLVVSVGTTSGTVFLCQHLACSSGGRSIAGRHRERDPIRVAAPARARGDVHRRTDRQRHTRRGAGAVPVSDKHNAAARSWASPPPVPPMPFTRGVR